jgi:hypothetical protein
MLRTWFLLSGAIALALGLTACGESEEAKLLANLQEEMQLANSAIDSLNYTVESSNLLIDELRARADSLQRVDDKLVQTIQSLNKEVHKWQQLASAQRAKNEEFRGEIERMKREKQVDQQTIGRIRGESDSLRSALLESHTSIRRQSDQIRQMETDLSQAQEDVVALRAAQISVHVLMGSEDFLKENGYLATSRSMVFRTTYQLNRKLAAEDPQVSSYGIGDPLQIQGKLKALVDRYGKLKAGKDYKIEKSGGQTTVYFINELLGGADVVAILD